MSERADRPVKTINENIGTIFKEKELDEKPVIRNFRITARNGKIYEAIEELAEQSYVVFDERRRKANAINADKDDLIELENIENELKQLSSQWSQEHGANDG